MYNERIEGTKITVYGSKSEIEEAKQEITKMSQMLTGNEGADRLILQNKVVEKIHARILYDGNSVWNKKRLLHDLRIVMNKGMESLSNELYHFFSLDCGSIAHYDKYGWISEYPNLWALRQFFKCNEFGQSILKHQPHWATDRIVIIKEMSKMLNVLSVKS